MINAMHNAGIEPPSGLIDDGVIHRYTPSTDKGKTNKNWYILFPEHNGLQSGAFGRWVGDNNGAIQWSNKSAKEFTPEEKKEYAKRQAELRRKQAEDRQRETEKCAAWCREAWGKAPEACDDHPYLKRKQVKVFGLRTLHDSLMVPVKTLDGVLRGIQFIKPDGSKVFKTGTPKQGAMHLIGRPKDNTLLIAEGYATAASIHMATGHAVLVAFDAGNLKPVAEAARKKRPDWKLIICADDDRWAKETKDSGEIVYHLVPCTLPGEKQERINTGVHKAMEAGQAVRAEVVKPFFPDVSTHPTDFNDLHALHGLEAVNLCIFPPEATTDNDEPPPPTDDDCRVYDNEPPPLVKEYSTDPFHDAPFILLGYNHGEYYYLPHNAPQVVALEAPAHSKPNLLRLARLQWWQMAFPGSKTGFDHEAAMNALIQTQHTTRGIYDQSKIRGRGAWEDGGKSVLHMGANLIVDGREYSIGAWKTKYIYEESIPMEFQVGMEKQVIGNREAIKLDELCRLLSWEKPISATLMAGWCMLAPICGALAWRPHIHITGGSGCGKSWIVENIVRPVAGPGALVVQGNTTEAGIRQSLGYDARPVIYDEAESEDKHAQARMQAILELARQASSETGGSIYKGSTGGKALQFRIRSMFCFSSIGVSATQRADQSRISVLGLKNNLDGGKRFDREISPAWKAIITEEFCRLIRARAIRLIPTIRANAAIFSEVVGHHLNSKRTGDQLGTLLAGAYALRAMNLIGKEAALEYVKGIDWGEHVLEAEETDEQRCLSVILESLVKVQMDRSQPAEDKSIGELIQHLAETVTIDDTSPAAKVLRRHGVKVVKGGFLIANKHTEIAKKLERTPWAANWSRILARLPGASKVEQVWFSGGASRAVMLPMSYVLP